MAYNESMTLPEDGGLCAVCGEGHATTQLSKLAYTYRGVTEEIDMAYQVCDHCESEYAGMAEMNYNFEVATDFRHRVDAVILFNNKIALQ